jgi:acetoin utilization deacetylase AcuC-like enzyme
MATGLVWHERYMWHDAGRWPGIVPPGGLMQPHETVEHPDAKRRLYNLIEVSGLAASLTRVDPQPASDDDLARFHDRGYLDRLRELSAGFGGDAGEVAPFGPGSYEIARLAVGGIIQAVDAVLAGRLANAYALVRPPGHHAEPGRGRGFCLLGNIAIAVKHAQAVRGVGRVAIVDWDVHHGNGTQGAFYGDPSVLTISLHQDRLYPLESGAVDENGDGKGRGLNINVPLPPGCGDGAYRAAIERVVLPALCRARPELIVVGCGFDASFLDPMGRMLCHSGTYREMTRMLMIAARDLCGGRLVLCHEGGYSPAYTPACGLAVIEELAGARTAYEDFAGTWAAAIGGQELAAHQEAAIAAAVPLVTRVT